jgi:hypothetical protein
MATATKKPTSAPLKKSTGVASTAVAVKKPAGNIVSIQEALRAQAAATSERVAPASGIKISTAGKQFSFPNGDKSTAFNAVVVDFVARNEFYEDNYDPSAIVPPVCFAIGSNPLKLVPSMNSPIRQSDSCNGCPMNEFKSKGNGKACSNTRYLAVLPPDADESTPIWLLKVSATALKGFDSFVAGVARSFTLPPVGVVVEITFDPATSYPKLVFSDPVLNENVADHFARQEEARELLAAEPDVSSFVADKPKASAKRAPARR